MIQEEHTRMIADSIPGCWLEILPGNHSVAQGNPEAYNQLVLQFLAEE